jgi:hypothetical protein
VCCPDEHKKDGRKDGRKEGSTSSKVTAGISGGRLVETSPPLLFFVGGGLWVGGPSFARWPPSIRSA